MSRICIGKIKAAHGIKGLVKVDYFGDAAPDAGEWCEYLSHPQDDTSIVIRFKNSQGKSLWLAEVEGVSDRTKAEEYRGTSLYISRDDLDDIDDEDTFYIVDLIGMTLVDENGQKTGIIANVQNFGAGDLLDIKMNNGKTFLVPFTKAHFPHISHEEKTITHSNISNFT